MKKTLCLISVLALLLSGCGGRNNISTEPTEFTPQLNETTLMTEAVPDVTTDPEIREPEITSPPTETDAEGETLPAATSAASESTEGTEHKHVYKFKVTKVPTCTTMGVRTYTCEECGASYKENIPTLDHAYVITVSEPDCSNSGKTTYHCKDCGYTYTDNIKQPLGHSYGPLVTLRNPTEVEPGLAEHICTRCGAAESVVLPRLNPKN